MQKTLRESIADFVRELAEAKKEVPVKIYRSPEGCGFAPDSIRAAIDTLYTSGEQRKLEDANNAVFARYEIKAYEDVVPLLEVPTELKLKNPEFMKSNFVELFEWTSGNVEYLRRHRDLHSHWREQLRKLHSTETRTNSQGKIELDLRFAMLNGCDLRYVKDHLNGKHLQLVDFENACLDFINISGAHIQGAECTNASCLGGCLHALRAHCANLSFSCAYAMKASGMYDGSLIGGSWVATSFTKGAVDDTRVSSFRCCKFKGADFRSVHFEPHYTPKASHRFHGANFYGSDWRSATFEGCCDFRYATMHIDVRDVDLSGCDLSHTICVDKMTVKFVKPLKPKPSKPGAACGTLVASIAKNVFFGDEEDGDQDEDQDDEETDDDEDDHDDKKSPLLRSSRHLSRSEEDDQRCVFLTSCCQSAAAHVPDHEESLLGLIEQGGARLGERALSQAVEVEAKLTKRLRKADKITQVQLKILLHSLKAQAKTLKKDTNIADVQGFEAMREELLKLGSSDLSRAALARAESTIHANAKPSVLISFLAAQLKQPMGYDVRGFFPMFKAVFTVNPSKMNSDSKEIQRLVNKFEKLDQPVLPTTWTEIADTWTTLYEDYKRMETERGLLILEQIFGNPKILQALSYARALHNIQKILEPPEELLIMLKVAKVELKRRVDEYQAAADRELVNMEKIQRRQQQLVGGISILMISIGTSLGNFASQYCYHRVFNASNTEL